MVSREEEGQKECVGLDVFVSKRNSHSLGCSNCLRRKRRLLYFALLSLKY